jgi:small subunit ribosomal protein S3Ae
MLTLLSFQVKVLKKPRFDLSKLLELHGDGGKSAEPTAAAAVEGVPVERPEGYEPPVMAAV